MGLLKLLEGVKTRNGQIELKRTKQLSAKQMRTLSGLGKEDANAYLMTLLGLTAENSIRAVRRKREQLKYDMPQDKLAIKRANSVVGMFNELTDATNSHRPTESGRGQWIGVEIECFLPHSSNDDIEYCSCEEDDDGNYIGTCCNGSSDGSYARSQLAEAIQRAKITRCTVKDDGSLSSNDGYSCEVCILLSPANGFEPLRRLCELLNAKGCFVNDTCGLHVHLDARHLDKDGVKLIGKRLGTTLPVLAQMVPSSRRTNTYCKLKVGKMSDRHDDKYYAVNLQAYSKFKTVEVRLHSSTTNYTKIANWISILKTIANTPIKGKVLDFQTFIDKIPIAPKLVEYMDKRISKFEVINSTEDILGLEMVPSEMFQPFEHQSDELDNLRVAMENHNLDRCNSLIQRTLYGNYMVTSINNNVLQIDPITDDSEVG